MMEFCFFNIYLFILMNSKSAIVLTLLFVMFHEFLQPKTSHLQLCTLYKSWRLDPARIHCESIHLAPQQNCVWLLGNTSYYHSRLRIYKSIGQRNVGKQSWNYETKFCKLRMKLKLKLKMTLNQFHRNENILFGNVYDNCTHFHEICMLCIANGDHSMYFFN